MKTLLESIRNNIEFISLFVSLIVAFVVYQVKYYSFFFVSFSFVLGVLSFIVLQKKFTNNLSTLKNIYPKNKKNIKYVLSIFFFVFYGLSVFSLLDGFFTKTVWYDLFISICAILISLEIFFIEKEREYEMNLLKTFLLFLNIALSNQIVFFYGIVSSDLKPHLDIINPIISMGHIVQGYTYSSFPLHHIFVSELFILLDFKDITILYGFLYCFVMSINILFVYMIGKAYFNAKLGLFAALAYTLSCDVLYYAMHPSQVSYALTLLVMIFGIVLYRYKTRNAKYSFLFVILAFAMVFSHHHSALVTLIILASFAFVEMFNYYEKERGKFLFPHLAWLFLIIMIAQWMYMSDMLYKLASILNKYYAAFLAETATQTITRNTFDQLPLHTLFMNEIGESIFVFFSVIGFLHYFKNPSFFKNIIIFITLLFFTLIGTEILLKESAIEPQRLYAYMQILALIFFVGDAIIWISNNAGKFAIPFVVLSIGGLSFFSVSSTITGFETGLFAYDMSYAKLYNTPFEKSAGNWINECVRNNSILTASSTFDYRMSNVSYHSIPVIEENYSGKIEYFVDLDNIENGSFIVFDRFDTITGFLYKALITGKFHLGSEKYVKLNLESTHLLDAYDKYYDNGLVDVHRKKQTVIY